MKVHAATETRLLTSAFLVISLCLVLAAEVFAAQSGQILLNGTVKKIDLTANTAIVTDYEGKDFKLTIEDRETINKFRDGRIKIGDDVNVKYRIKDGTNIPFSFRKLAGC